MAQRRRVTHKVWNPHLSAHPSTRRGLISRERAHQAMGTAVTLKAQSHLPSHPKTDGVEQMVTASHTCVECASLPSLSGPSHLDVEGQQLSPLGLVRTHLVRKQWLVLALRRFGLKRMFLWAITVKGITLRAA